MPTTPCAETAPHCVMCGETPTWHPRAAPRLGAPLRTPKSQMHHICKQPPFRGPPLSGGARRRRRRQTGGCGRRGWARRRRYLERRRRRAQGHPSVSADRAIALRSPIALRSRTRRRMPRTSSPAPRGGGCLGGIGEGSAIGARSAIAATIARSQTLRASQYLHAAADGGGGGRERRGGAAAGGAGGGAGGGGRAGGRRRMRRRV